MDSLPMYQEIKNELKIQPPGGKVLSGGCCLGELTLLSVDVLYDLDDACDTSTIAGSRSKHLFILQVKRGLTDMSFQCTKKL